MNKSMSHAITRSKHSLAPTTPSPLLYIFVHLKFLVFNAYFMYVHVFQFN